jgi:hypothetical protein
MFRSFGVLYMRSFVHDLCNPLSFRCDFFESLISPMQWFERTHGYLVIAATIGMAVAAHCDDRHKKWREFSDCELPAGRVQAFSKARASNSNFLNPLFDASLMRCAVPPGPSGSRSGL